VPISFFHSVIEKPIFDAEPLVVRSWVVGRWCGLLQGQVGVVFSMEFRSERLAPGRWIDRVGFSVRSLLRHVGVRHAMSRHER
jgi:hypothetical protein